MPREDGIVERIKRAIGSAYPEAKVEKYWGGRYTTRGHPDLFGCVLGRAFAIEVKQPGKEPEPAQHAQLNQWARAGAITGWATSPDEALTILREGLRCI